MHIIVNGTDRSKPGTYISHSCDSGGSSTDQIQSQSRHDAGNDGEDTDEQEEKTENVCHHLLWNNPVAKFNGEQPRGGVSDA